MFVRQGASVTAHAVVLLLSLYTLTAALTTTFSRGTGLRRFRVADWLAPLVMLYVGATILLRA